MLQLNARRVILLLALCGSLAAVDRHAISPAQWRADLRYFQREIERRHKNAFHFTPREKFEQAVAELDARLDGLTYDQVYVAIERLAAMIGDAHTNINLPEGFPTAFPIRVREYGGEVRVVSALPGSERALGARLVRIEDTSAAAAIEKMIPLYAQDEHPWYLRTLAVTNMIAARLLHGLDIISDPAAAAFTFADDAGREFTLPLHAQPVAQQPAAQWIPIAPGILSKIGEPMTRPTETFAYTYVPDARTVYCNVRSMRALRKPAAALFAFAAGKRAEKLIIDLRQNPGGSYFEGLHHLIEPLRKMPEINRKGRLFVLIGTLTGSAAIIDASMFHTKTEALLVGQPIGAKPTEYSERRQMKLPNSHLTVNYSVKFYQFAYNDENVIRPDHEIVSSWDDVKAGRDAALDWCLKYPSAATPPTVGQAIGFRRLPSARSADANPLDALLGLSLPPTPRPPV